MRVLILQGSSRQNKGITEMVVESFIKGMKKADPSAEIQTEYLAGKRIENCRGCLSCWIRTPGSCCIRDDMDEIIGEYNNSDVIITATPVYIDSMSSHAKRAWERLLPVMEPNFECDGRGVRHKVRGEKQKSLFVISTCAMPELEHFDPLIETFRRISRNFNMKYAGHLLRPESHSLTYVKRYADRIGDVLEGIEKCGEEFVETAAISPETLSRAQQCIMEGPQAFAEINNRMWDKLLDTKR